MQKKMNVCIASLFGMDRPSGSTPPNRMGGCAASCGGIQSHCRWLMKYFEEQGVSCTHVSPYNCPKGLVYPVFAVRHVCKGYWKTASSIWFRHWHFYFLERALEKAVARERFDIVNAQGPLSALAALRVRQRCGAAYQVVLTVHMNWPSQADEEAFAGTIAANGRAYKKIKRLERMVFPLVDKIIFVSGYIQELCLREYPALSRRCRTIIYNGTGGGQAGENGRDKAQGRPVLINIGHLEKRKNQQFLFGVVKYLCGKGLDPVLYLVGEGRARGTLAQSSVKEGIRDRVCFTGARQDTRRLLTQSHVYVHAALAESCPYAILEAFACAVPVVACSVGGVPEIVEHGVTGFLAGGHDVEEYAGYIERLLTDKDLYHAMRHRCREVFHERFTYQKMGQEYLRFYTEGLRLSDDE